MDNPIRLPEPTPLATTAAVAKALAVEAKTAEKCMRAGLFGRVYETPRNLMVEPATVDQIANRPEALPHNAFVVRLAPAVLEQDPDRAGRRWMGWHSALAGEPDVTRCYDRWWPIRDPEATIGRPLVAVVGPIVVAVRTIVRLIPEFGRYRVETTEPTPDALGRFDGRLLRLPAGAVALRLPD